MPHTKDIQRILASLNAIYVFRGLGSVYYLRLYLYSISHRVVRPMSFFQRHSAFHSCFIGICDTSSIFTAL